MRLRNLLRSLAVCLALFVFSSNAADTAAVAHVIYDGNGLYYADNGGDIKFKSLSIADDGMYTIAFNKERLNGRSDTRPLRFGLQCIKDKDSSFCETFLNPDEANQPTLKELYPNYTEDDSVRAEIWLYVDSASGTVQKFSTFETIPENIKAKIPQIQNKVIRLLPSWSNTTAIMFLNGNEEHMIPMQSPYCGWLEANINLVMRDVYVSFKQTIGDSYIGKDGIEKQPISVESEINLDSALQLSDTVWIAAKFGFPEISTTYPGELGDCPVKKLPVMMFDWLHGDGSDEENRLAQAGTTSQDFGTGGCARDAINDYTKSFGDGDERGGGVGYVKGMVEEKLGANGVPVRAANFPQKCKYTDHLDNWFLPEVVKVDGKEYNNVTCRELTLTLDSAGFWLGQRDVDSPERGMFLLDDFLYLDSAKTVKNPFYDNIEGKGKINNVEDNLGFHNYGFSMKVQAQFEYIPGQEFEFFGDDDVWVFINNKLVVDIGGQHHQAKAKVKLDTIGHKTGDSLVPGQTYPFHIFYAERHKIESNFKMRTSIDLKTDASMFFKDLSSDPNFIQKDVYQIVRERELACDFSSSPETEKVELGPSNFVLYGKGVPKGGVALKTQDSAYYAGITISEGFTRVTIDRETLSSAMLLPPGTYYIRVTLQSNPDEYKDIPFTVDPHALPNLAFAQVLDDDSVYFNIGFNIEDTLWFDQLWAPLGDSISRDINSDTLSINPDKSEKKMWAGRSYPVYVMFAEEWASMYSFIPVTISTSTPALVPCDSMGNPINEVILTQGRASFFIKAVDEVVNGTLTISSSGADNKSVNWTNINIAVPPVPQIETAFIYDRNGDGRGDSIWIHFKKALGGQSVLDSIKFTFGSKFDKPYKAKYNDGDDIATVAADGNFGTAIFTGGATSPYSGLLTVFYTYTDDAGEVSYFPVEGSLNDAIGPVIIAAAVDYLNDGSTLLKLSFSEGVDNANAAIDLFSFHCWKNKALETAVKAPGSMGTEPANQWNLIFKGGDLDIIPSVGDSVRFTPPSMGGQAYDLVGSIAHENNPWVRITGKPKVTITSPKVVTLDPASDNFQTALEIIKSESHTVPKLVVSEQPMNAEQVAAVYGTQGHYLGTLDMAELVENQIADIVKAVQETPLYYDKKELEGDAGLDSLTAPSHTIEEIIADVSSGKISIGEAKDRFGVSDVIVDAYKSGLLTKENLASYSSGSEADIKNIVSSVADKTVLTYQTYYYTSLGHYVSGQSGSISCNDDIYKDGGRQNCLGSDGKLFLAWNMRADNGRLAATGVYIARLEYRVSVNGKEIVSKTQDFLWGVRRGQVNAIDLGL